MSKPYTATEANTLLQMLKDLATMKADHPLGPTYNYNRATEEITEAREWVIDMLKEQEK